MQKVDACEHLRRNSTLAACRVDVTWFDAATATFGGGPHFVCIALSSLWARACSSAKDKPARMLEIENTRSSDSAERYFYVAYQTCEPVIVTCVCKLQIFR